MKILTTCFSQTGNTAKVARAIYEAALSQDHEVHLKEIGDWFCAKHVNPNPQGGENRGQHQENQ